MNILPFDLSLDKIVQALSYDPAAPMIFSSGVFLWLFLFFILIYFALQKQDTVRILFVTLFSYYFYYKSSGVYFFLLAIVTCSDFLIAKKIDKSSSRQAKKSFVFLSLLINLGLLAYFKYTNFFGDLFSRLIGMEFSALDIFLPVGISFFTFQSLSYTIDVYRGKLKPLERLLDYAFYVSFFPQLVAGPIVRARDFIPQIRKPLFVSQKMFGVGVFFIICGLFKKAVISDYISVNFVERIFDNPMLYSGIENLLAIYGYALQIYCDFSGYSDMAIGIALLLGFKFPLNFDSPYKSASITEFWRRWHISLSSWLRDYLYISLGGNRKGKFRQILNLMITMLLGGLWHGASLNFIVWGGMHGLALSVHKIIMNVRGKSKTEESTGLLRIGGIILTFHFVCLTWVFFRSSSFENALNMLMQIFSDFRPQVFFQLIEAYWQVFVLIAIGYLLHFSSRASENAFKNSITIAPFLVKVVLLIGLIFIVIQIKSSDIQPFIYFQF